MENIEKAILLKNELDGLRPINPNDEKRIMQKFRLDWNYHSNNLEGNTLTYGETKALLLFNITAQAKPLKDHFEITGHNEAIDLILDFIKDDRPLTENFIREIHKLILKEPYEVDAVTPDGKPTKKLIKVGEYKTSQNHVKTKTGEIFRFAEPEETPAKMNDLINWYRSKENDEKANPILLASEFHYKYIRIHPFDDGNGRTARIFMNFILMKFGYPPVIIKTNDKENYFGALRQADAGIIKAFVDYISGNLVESLELMIKGAKGGDIGDEDDLDKELKLLEKRLETITDEHKYLKTEELVFDVVNKVVFPFLKKFVKSVQKFEKFYDKMDVSLTHNRVGTTSFSSIRIGDDDKLLETIGVDTNYIGFRAQYRKFNKMVLTQPNYDSEFRILFKESNYHLVLDKTSVGKYIYGDYINSTTMDKVLLEMNKVHKNLIEQKVNKKLSNKK